MLPMFHRNLDITEQQTSRAESAIFKFNQTFMNIRLCTKMGSDKTLFIFRCFNNSCYYLHYFDYDDICSKGPGQALFDSCSPSTWKRRDA